MTAPFDGATTRGTEPTLLTSRLGARVMELIPGMMELIPDMSEADVDPNLSNQEMRFSTEQRVALNKLWSVCKIPDGGEVYFLSTGLQEAAKVQPDDELDWGFSVEVPPARRSRKIKIKLLRKGRGKPALNLSADEG